MTTPLIDASSCTRMRAAPGTADSDWPSIFSLPGSDTAGGTVKITFSTSASNPMHPLPAHGHINRTHLIARPHLDDAGLAHVGDSGIIGSLVVFSNFVGAITASAREPNRSFGRAGIHVVSAGGDPIQAIF